MHLFKSNPKPKPRILTGISGVLVTAIVAASIANAQIPLQAKLALRPVTPGEISTNKLPATTETSPGLINVGLGQPAIWKRRSISQSRLPTLSV